MQNPYEGVNFEPNMTPEESVDGCDLGINNFHDFSEYLGAMVETFPNHSVEYLADVIMNEIENQIAQRLVSKLVDADSFNPQLHTLAYSS